MRKKILTFTALLAALIVMTFAFAACGRKDGAEEYDPVSRQTSEFYAGANDDIYVSVEFGRRERNFIADGRATEVGDFCEITVVPLKTHDFEKLDFTLKAGESTFEGVVEHGDFGEFRAEISPGFAPESVTFKSGESFVDIPLINILKDAISSDKAIDIATEQFADRIAEESAGGVLDREIYLKVISGDREHYYYYVSFIGEGTDYWAMLIDPATGDVVSKK